MLKKIGWWVDAMWGHFKLNRKLKKLSQKWARNEASLFLYLFYFTRMSNLSFPLKGMNVMVIFIS